MAAPPSPRAAPRASRPGIPSSASLAAWLALAVCVALAWWGHRRCLTAYFAPDDLISLERARGLLPPYPVPFWRVFSGSGYFTVALRVFGVDPFPYHLVNLLTHSLNVALVFLLARRWSGRVFVAALAAGLFGTSRLYATALVQVVGFEELLATAFTLLALLAFDGQRPRRVLVACGLFAAALLSKESVLLVPLVLLLPLAPAASWRNRILGVGAMLAVSGAYLGAFIASRGGLAVSGGEAYATAYGTNLFHNLMTYVSWMANVRDVAPDLISGASTTAWRQAIWIVAALAALGAAAWRQPSRVLAGFTWFLAALLPVLAYLNHSYAFYLYPALPGIAIAVAHSCDALLRWATGRDPAAKSPAPPAPASGRARGGPAPRRRAPAAAARTRAAREAAGWLIAAALVLTQVLISERLTARRWETLIPGTRLSTDPALRKSGLARNVVSTLGPSIAGRRTSVMFLTPPEGSQFVDIATGKRVANMKGRVPNLLVSVLDEGRALRAIFPQLDSVAFVHRWSAAYRDFDLVANTNDGFVTNFGQGPAAHAALAAALLGSGNAGLALADLGAALTVYPNDPRLLKARAEAFAALRARIAPRK